MNPSYIVKYLLFLFTFSISAAQTSYSNDFTGDIEPLTDLYGADSNKGCIIYEFGFSKINSVFIIKNDTHFDVYISDGHKVNLSKRCEMTTILNWAFEKAPIELTSAQFVINNVYEPLYYKLTIIIDRTPIIIDSSAMRIIGNEALAKKIDELKSFIISLWQDSLVTYSFVSNASRISLAKFLSGYFSSSQSLSHIFFVSLPQQSYRT